MDSLHISRLIVALSLLVASLAGCGERAAEHAGKQIDQATGQVSEKIDAAAGKVAQKVEEATDKAAAKIEDATGKVAQKIDQVASTVKQGAEDAGRKVGKVGERAGEAIADTGITTEVKAAILAFPGLKSLDINVDTRNGVVFLTGIVDSDADRQRSGEIAAAVDGVRSVENHLLVNPSDTRRFGAAGAMNAARAEPRSDLNADVSRRE